MDLLHPAFLIQIHHLHHPGIPEVRDMRIIESDMSVFSYPHEYYIGGIFHEKPGIPPACLLRSRLSIDIVDTAERSAAEYGPAQIIAETLRGIPRKPDILIHVEGIDPRPDDSAVGDQALLHRLGLPNEAPPPPGFRVVPQWPLCPSRG